ncbi:MAG: hypothetical protein AAFN27_00055 [Pseudomonadota bacterium]
MTSRQSRIHGSKQVLRASLGAAALAFCLGLASPTSVALAADPPKEAEAEAETNDRPDPLTAASNPLSGIGRSGLRVYHFHCESCHGYLGEGTRRAPALAGTIYATDHASRRRFHEQFRTAYSKHAQVARGTRDRPGPRFNELEMVAKFLREVEVWRKTITAATGN